jgi:hypothetical protein
MPVASQVPSTAANASSVSSGGSSTVVASSQSLMSAMFAPSSMAPERVLPVKSPPPCLSTDASSSIFSAPFATVRQQFAQPPHMSATAMLQKAAQMGATSSSSSFLRGLGLDVSTSSPGPSSSVQAHHPETPLQWLETEAAPMLSAGLGLGLPYGPTGAPVCLPELMTGQSPLFSTKPATQDFLGLGMSMSPTGESASRGLSASVQPIGGAVGIGGSGAGVRCRPWSAGETLGEKSEQFAISVALAIGSSSKRCEFVNTRERKWYKSCEFFLEFKHTPRYQMHCIRPVQNYSDRSDRSKITQKTSPLPYYI